MCALRQCQKFLGVNDTVINQGENSSVGPDVPPLHICLVQNGKCCLVWEFRGKTEGLDVLQGELQGRLEPFITISLFFFIFPLF